MRPSRSRPTHHSGSFSTLPRMWSSSFSRKESSSPVLALKSYRQRTFSKTGLVSLYGANTFSVSTTGCCCCCCCGCSCGALNLNLKFFMGVFKVFKMSDISGKGSKYDGTVNTSSELVLYIQKYSLFAQFIISPNYKPNQHNSTGTSRLAHSPYFARATSHPRFPPK